MSVWHQVVLSLGARPRGIHIITDEISRIPELKQIKIGLAHILLRHTSASLSLNECWDPSVRTDMEMMLNRIAPENAPYKHTLEGPDDMPAHVKTCLVGAEVTVPITNGKLNLGTWQGIWLCEHRDHASPRSVVVTLQGTS